MSRGNVTDSDRGYKALLKRMQAATKDHAITVGVHDEEGAGQSESGKTVADIAAINEFGGDAGNNPPPRSFVGAWADDYQSTHEANLVKMGQGLVKGTVSDVVQGLTQLALLYEGLVKARIQAGIAPPNAESTAKRKGSSKPLIRYGQLIGAIRGKVQSR